MRKLYVVIWEPGEAAGGELIGVFSSRELAVEAMRRHLDRGRRHLDCREATLDVECKLHPAYEREPLPPT